MKNLYVILGIILFLVSSSFKTDRACEYVGSNIEYIEVQTKKALLENDLNKTKYQTYKAINAIEKTRAKLADCGCTYASKNLLNGLEDLIKSTKTSTIKAAHIYIERALKDTNLSLESLKEHYMHKSIYPVDVLELNTKKEKTELEKKNIISSRELHQKIDTSLEKFEKSLSIVVETVNCKDATKFTQNIYDNCEKELLKENLTDGKKYYNLRTKHIAAQALKKLENCQ